eukprot:gnl/TRDRNA2_/TRDRNA2_121646_c0_seq1.p1 gnl/TRDRNA2_/TRDRNA2_121646_c0~~gnl/TRDRNA2_/TRDRNA2_121646_c0_seq1.p1  ORF type:complete len:429 (+),score=89.22 gnl/TRDRNA2_/TRDRNA2_121646_c0_seq1:86-1288(+)
MEDGGTMDMEVEEPPKPYRITLGHPPVVFAMPGSEELAVKASAHLGWQLGACSFKVHNNGELSVKLEQGVANCDVFILCVRDDDYEVNCNLVRLLLLADCIKSETPHRLTVLLPCLEYARQDRKIAAGEGIPPKMFLRCLKTAGVDRYLTVDLHNQAEVAFAPLGCALDELTAERYLADFIKCNVPGFDADKMFVCATNGGGMKFTRRMADILGTGFMMADRFRLKAGGEGEIRIISDSSVAQIQGVIIIDDMYDTCGNLVEVVEALHAFAPTAKLYAVGSHGYFSGDAPQKVQRLAEKCNLEWIAVTNSISPSGAMKRFGELGCLDKLKIVDISRLIAGAIIRIHLGASVNLRKFRNLGPAMHDPVLQEASLVPSYQYTHMVNPVVQRSAQLAKRPSIV